MAYLLPFSSSLRFFILLIGLSGSSINSYQQDIGSEVVAYRIADLISYSLSLLHVPFNMKRFNALLSTSSNQVHQV